jgi:hypothetical protein
MIKIKVAWGMTNSMNAQDEDPNAEKEILQFNGEPMYTSYELKNEDELHGFELAVKEMDSYLTGYIVTTNNSTNGKH